MYRTHDLNNKSTQTIFNKYSLMLWLNKESVFQHQTFIHIIENVITCRHLLGIIKHY